MHLSTPTSAEILWFLASLFAETYMLHIKYCIFVFIDLFTYLSICVHFMYWFLFVFICVFMSPCMWATFRRLFSPSNMCTPGIELRIKKSAFTHGTILLLPRNIYFSAWFLKFLALFLDYISPFSFLSLKPPIHHPQSLSKFMVSFSLLLNIFLYI